MFPRSLCALLALSLGACDGCGARARGPTAADPADLGAHVVASSEDLSVRVLRRDAELIVHAGPRRTTVRALALDGPGAWVSVSPDGATLVEVDASVIRATDLRASRTRWEAEGALWGPPVFSPDGATLALPEQGHVTLLDARTGEAIRRVGGTGSTLELGAYRASLSSRLSNVRALRFAPSGRALVASCESIAPGTANHTLFVIDVASGDVVGELPGHAEPARMTWLDDERIVSVDGEGRARLFRRDGRMLAETAPGLPSSFIVADGAHVLLASEGIVVLWSPGHAEVRERRHAHIEMRAIALEGERASLLTASGALYPIDSPETRAPVRIEDHEDDPEEMAARWALHLLDSPAHDEAVRALSPFAARDDAPLYRALHIYGVWRIDDEPTPLERRFAERGFSLETPAHAAVVLAAATRVASAGQLVTAAALYSAWLRVRRETDALRAQDIDARALGHDLIRALSSLDAEEAAQRYALAMFALWPGDPALALYRAEALVYDDPEEAARILDTVITTDAAQRVGVEDLRLEVARQRNQRRLVEDPEGSLADARARARSHPADPAAWGTLFDALRQVAPESLAAAVAEARPTLGESDAEAALVLAGAYRDAGDPDAALEAYRRAARLRGPGEGSYMDAERIGDEIDAIERRIAAIPELRQAVDVDPTDAYGWGTYLDALASVRRSELEPEIARARSRLDPRSRSSWSTLGFAYAKAYRYPEARESLQRAIDLAEPGEIVEALVDMVELLDRRISRGRADAP